MPSKLTKMPNKATKNKNEIKIQQNKTNKTSFGIKPVHLHAILCQQVTIFYRQEQAPLFQVQDGNVRDKARNKEITIETLEQSVKYVINKNSL